MSETAQGPVTDQPDQAAIDQAMDDAKAALTAAEEAALQARAASQNNKNGWFAEKESMINWLRQNVGSNINTPMSHLQDLIIKKSKETRETALNWFKESRIFLQYLEDPVNQYEITDGPREDDNLDKELPNADSWTPPASTEI